LDGGSAHRKDSTYTGHIHFPSGIRTRDPNVICLSFSLLHISPPWNQTVDRHSWLSQWIRRPPGVAASQTVFET